jgi:hypothetical protein
MNRHISPAVVLSSILLATALAFNSTQAAPRVFMHLYYNDQILRTFGVPAPLPHGGNDPLFTFPDDAADGQLSITQFAPGDPEFSGGAWAVYEVTFNVEPYLLTSYDDLIDAAMAGDVEITRNADRDFRCPVLP